jgi:DNA-binding NtrC family response regulator
MTERSPIRVLLVDDDPLFLKLFTSMLKRQGLDVTPCDDPIDGVARIHPEHYDAAVVDYKMPGRTGAEVISDLRARRPQLVCIGLTGEGATNIAFSMLNAGAADYFEKPVQDMGRFLRVLTREIESSKVRAANEELQDALRDLRDVRGLSALVGNSPAMIAFKDQLVRFARSGKDVLVVGESGTGKELVASAIHLISGTNAPMLPVNMGGLNSNLIQSELFGHEAGSFVDAKARRKGVLETAGKGTVFLDEIGELPISDQANLLRALENRTFTRVGGSEIVRLHARVVAATNRDLELEVCERRFREDLLYRLNPLTLFVPPLRDRKEDISTLVYYFIDKYNSEFSKNIKRVEPEAMAALERHDWRRNNVRELRNTIMQAMVNCNSREEVLRIGRLKIDGKAPQVPVEVTIHTESGESVPAPFDRALLNLPWKDAKESVVEQFAVWYLRSQLIRANFNITRAADLAGMQRSNFSAMMKSYGINLDDIKHQYIVRD